MAKQSEERVTKADLARRIHRDPNVVTRMIATGRLPREALREDGTIAYLAAYEALRGRYPQMPRPVGRRADPPPRDPPGASVNRPRGRPPNPNGSATRTLAEEQAKLTRVRRQRLELEYMRETRQLADVAIVGDLGAELAETMRQGLLQMVPEMVRQARGAGDEMLADRALRDLLRGFQEAFALRLEERVRALGEGVVEDDLADLDEVDDAGG